MLWSASGRSLGFSLTCSLAFFVAGCNTSALDLKGNAATDTTAQTSTSSKATTSTASADASGSLSLTEPDAASDAVVKLRIAILDSASCKEQAKPDHPAGKRGRRPPPPAEDGKAPPKRPDDQQADRQPPPPPDKDQQGGNGKRPALCVVKDTEADYEAGKELTLDEIPVGTYTVVVTLEDENGQPLEQGSAEVTVADGETAQAEITLAPVEQQATGSISITIKNPIATKLGFAGIAISQDVDVCGAVRLQVQNDAGGPALTFSKVSIALASSSTAGVFYRDSSCTTAITSIDIAALHWTIRVFYKDSAAGTPSLTATETTAQGLSAATISATINE